MIKDLISDLSYVDNIVIDENNVILGGHGRIKALKELGYKEIKVKQVKGWTEKQKEKYLLGSNQSTILGGFNDDLLKEFDKDILLESGFDVVLELTKPEKERKKRKVKCPECGFEWNRIN